MPSTSWLVAHSDCQGSIKSATDAQHALSGANVRRHLWQNWWNTHGGHARVVKVMGHMAHSDVTDGVSAWQKRGNDLADF